MEQQEQDAAGCADRSGIKSGAGNSLVKQEFRRAHRFILLVSLLGLGLEIAISVDRYASEKGVPLANMLMMAFWIFLMLLVHVQLNRRVSGKFGKYGSDGIGV